MVQGWRDLFWLLGWVKPDRQTPHSPKTRKIKSLQPEQTGRHNTETSTMFGERDPFRRLQKFYMGLESRLRVKGIVWGFGMTKSFA